jgi:phage tail sheath protein FI
MLNAAIQFENVPGVKIKEERLGAPPIQGVSTSRAGFVGKAPRANEQKMVPVLITSHDQFLATYVLDLANATNNAKDSTPLSLAVLGFFQNGGSSCYVVNAPGGAGGEVKDGLALLEKIDDIQILAAPGSTEQAVYLELQQQAGRKGDRFAILDAPAKDKVTKDADLLPTGTARPSSDNTNSAFYYPQIKVPGQLDNDPDTMVVAPTGHIAGLYARVDANRGVHKAPANEVLFGALGVDDLIGDSQQDTWNKKGVNVIRIFSEGPVVWGARTLNVDQGDPFVYVNIRRLTTYIEQSLKAGLRFAVFEPNNLALRQTITRSVRGFLDGVWRDGALFGATADEAYYVRFPESLNTPEKQKAGELTVEIGLRASYPAEFIIIRIGLL